LHEKLAIAGSGTIAAGLAAVAAAHGEVLVWARSHASAERVRASVAKHCDRHPELKGCDGRVRVVDDLETLAEATFLVEAVVEDPDHKGPLLAELASYTGPDEILATTTSSLSIAELATASGHPDRFVGLHVFNPVPRMELVELAFGPDTRDDVRLRARALCEALGKTPVEVPDIPGFVVNRLLFPYLFNAVDLMVQSGMTPEDVDRCMTLGAGMPMGPIALLDFVGLDVSQAIGETIGVAVPARLVELVESGALGRKARRGFYDYEGSVSTTTTNH
jgi:3-hydroxybutyryl-CoA dehydrogenase